MVIRYGYLWRDEQRRGLFEARKDRPAAIILAHDDPKSGEKIVVVLPITHTPPSDITVAIPLPPEVKQSLGLDGERSWILCNEVNRFRWPGFDLRPIPGKKPAQWSYGMMPRGLYEQAKNLFLTLRQQGRIKLADRDKE